MKLDQLTVLLPCHSLEDFTLSRSADEAEQLLGCWSALWHPTLLDEAQAVPTWESAENPPQATEKCLFTIPDCSGELLPVDWVDNAKTLGAAVLPPIQDRRAMVDAALKTTDAGQHNVDPDLVADFHALGYGYLVVELLTRQLRYMSNLDEASFKSSVLLAAKEAVTGDIEAAKTQLQSAFDLLHESREYFYPVEAHLLDLTLVAPTTLGGSVRSELAGQFPSNLLVTAEVIQRMAQEEPSSLEALAEALANKRAALVGGALTERELPLLTPEAILHDLSRGIETYEKLLQARPTVFGRRRFGLTPLLPGILKKLGFKGVLHCTLDDGRFPTGNQSRIQWEGIDATVLETVGRVPIDVSRADAFLRLSERLGDAMDLDHVATIVLAHWPGQSSPWYEDLRRIAKYSTVLGTFST
ncbi:MAG TPA: hypothetical protein VE890_00130, partial [Thermoguttaceae bacterium]|nr:hypothetical protein [Thermoguttaceae bacterium]